jgi:hypothetical protein
MTRNLNPTVRYFSTSIERIKIPKIVQQYAQDYFTRRVKNIDHIGIPIFEINKSSDNLWSFLKENPEGRNFLDNMKHAFNRNRGNMVILSSDQPPLLGSDLNTLSPSYSIFYSSLFCGLQFRDFKLSPMSLNHTHQDLQVATFGIFNGTLPLAFHHDYVFASSMEDGKKHSKISLIPYIGIFNVSSNSEHKTQVILNEEVIENMLNHFPRSYEILSNVGFTVSNPSYGSDLENVKIINITPDQKKSLTIFDENCEFKFNKADAERLNLKKDDIDLAFSDLIKAIELTPKFEAVLNDHKDQIILLNNRETLHARIITPQIDSPATKTREVRIIGVLGIQEQVIAK